MRVCARVCVRARVHACVRVCVVWACVRARRHYTGTLAAGGKQFDSSRGRGAFEFEIGRGLVIEGWDRGVMEMSLGEKATLHIPADLG